MKTMRIMYRVVIALTLLLLACNGWAQTQKDKEVVVINTSTKPVPVVGLVGISGTASVQVRNTVPVTGSVGINGTPSVNVANTVPVSFHSAQKDRISFSMNNANKYWGLALITLPQSAVLEVVSGICAGGSSPSQVSFNLYKPSAGIPTAVNVVPGEETGTTVSSGNPDNYIGGWDIPLGNKLPPTRVDIPVGTTFSIQAVVPSNTRLQCWVTLVVRYDQ